MSSQAASPHNSPSPAETAIHTVYQQLLDNWNTRNADAYAALFALDGHVIGFDGSEMNGQAEIAATLQQIFANHPTAPYVWKIRDVRFLTPTVAVLRAVVGMVPPGQADINPAVNAIQTLVAVRHDNLWRIALFQNTPAQYHGRPELGLQLTEELQQRLG